jgi:predicted metal-dependent hydrolase
MPSLPERERLAATAARPAVEIRRSARRRKTVSARREGEGILLMVPASVSRAEALEHLDRLLPRLRRSGPAGVAPDDAALAARARAVAQAHLGPEVSPRSIRWVTNQNTRWGSTTPARGSIRISHRLRGVPGYVLDYVIHHELCHLLEASHNARFRRLEARYPQMERARAFLEGMLHQSGAGPGAEPDQESLGSSGSCGSSSPPSS